MRPLYSKADIKQMLPRAGQGACRKCIFFFRNAITKPVDIWPRPCPTCPRCGILKWQVLRELREAHLRRRGPHALPEGIDMSSVQTSLSARLCRWLGL